MKRRTHRHSHRRVSRPAVFKQQVKRKEARKLAKYRPNDKGCGKKPRLRISTDKGCDDQHCDNQYRNAGP